MEIGILEPDDKPTIKPITGKFAQLYKLLDFCVKNNIKDYSHYNFVRQSQTVLFGQYVINGIIPKSCKNYSKESNYLKIALDFKSPRLGLQSVNFGKCEFHSQNISHHNGDYYGEENHEINLSEIKDELVEFLENQVIKPFLKDQIKKEQEESRNNQLNSEVENRFKRI